MQSAFECDVAISSVRNRFENLLSPLMALRSVLSHVAGHGQKLDRGEDALLVSGKLRTGDPLIDQASKTANSYLDLREVFSEYIRIQI